MTGRSRGFAFIVFKDLSGIEAALAQTAHVVKGKKVTCKKAEARQGKVLWESYLQVILCRKKIFRRIS